MNSPYADKSTTSNCSCNSSFSSRYYYHGSTDVDWEISLDTLTAARKYLVTELEETCRDIIFDCMDIDSVFEIYTYSVAFRDDILHQQCNEYLRNYAVAVPQAFEMLSEQQLTYEALLDMLRMNDRNIVNPWDNDKLGILVSDKDLFVACHEWAIEECKHQVLQPSGPNKRRVLGDCLSLMRFPCMLTSDIVEVVLPTGILNEEEKASLLGAPHKENAQPMFPSTKQCFVAQLGYEMEDRMHYAAKEIRKPREPTEWYFHRNTVEFTAWRRLVLSQIWLLPTDYDGEGLQRAKYKVVIKDKDGRKTRQSVVSQVIGTEDNPVMLLLDLEPFICEEDGEYVLKVLDKGWHDNDDRWDWPKEMYENLLSKVKDGQHTYLDVTGNHFNELITGFTISYL